MTENIDDSFEIRFGDRDGYLYAFVSGEEDSSSAGLIYWQQIIDECVKRNYGNLLMEEDFPNQVSTIDMYQVVEALSKMIPHGLKIAFVDRKPDPEN